jgi:excisionase family DNA binding protein
MLTVAQAAAELDVSVWVIYRLCQSRRLPHRRVGRRIQIPAEPLAQWYAARTYLPKES